MEGGKELISVKQSLTDDSLKEEIEELAEEKEDTTEEEEETVILLCCPNRGCKFKINDESESEKLEFHKEKCEHQVTI